MTGLRQSYHETEGVLLEELRKLRRVVRERQHHTAQPPDLALGQRIADRVAAIMGSWAFIILQSMILTAWIVLNVGSWIKAWDPYPFILLNLALSFQAAYAAPIIMMSQNRQSQIDRKAAEIDAKINVKAELEIELLHHKMDELRQQEVQALTAAVHELAQLLNRAGLGAIPEVREASELVADHSSAQPSGPAIAS